MLDAGHDARAARRQCGEDERGPGAQVGDPDLGPVERRRTGDPRPSLVDDLDVRAHLHQLAGVVEPVLEDRLVDRGDAIGLGQQDRERGLVVGREAGVGLRLDVDGAQGRRVAAADVEGGGVRIGLVGDAHALADLEEGAEVQGVHAAKGDVTAGDGGGDGERLRLQPVAEHAVVGAAQPIHALDLDAPLGRA